MGTVCIVMNVRNKALTQYHNFSYDSLCAWRGSYLLGNGQGIFETSEQYNDDTGAEISAFARFVALDFGISARKRIRSAELSYMSEGEMVISWQGDERDLTSQQILPEVDDGTFQTLQIPGDRSVEGTYLGFTLANTGGAGFTLNRLQIVPQLMQIGKSRR